MYFLHTFKLLLMYLKKSTISNVEQRNQCEGLNVMVLSLVAESMA
jgi:hypothetical protein